jgi:DNA polymerase III subunit beta
MKLQVTQENLSRALATVARVATNRGTLPVLANVLIKTADNRLQISATNLDIAISETIGAKISQEGSITVPARLFQDYIASLPSGVIDLKLDDYKLHIKADSYTSTINGINADDFPVMPAISGDLSWKLPAKTLKQSLQQVVLAASHDEARPVLTGVFIHNHDGVLYVVATDSYRLAEKRIGNSKIDLRLLVPFSAMQDLLRIVDDSSDEVTVAYDDQQVLFRTGDVELVTRLIDGNYPDYRKLIPMQFANTATLDKQELTNITKVASLFARESAGSIVVTVDEHDGKLHVRSVASQFGENTSSAAATVSGDGSITINSRYLMDALGVMQDKQVSFQFNGKLDPVVITDTSHDDYVHVIMPLKS